MSTRQRRRDAVQERARAIEERRDEQERAREHETETLALRDAFNQNGELSRDWMSEILNTSDVEERLQKQTIKKIQGLLNKQWILSKLAEAETHDREYWLEVHKLKILGQHPPAESRIQGPIRAFLYDDETEELNALTPAERNAIDQIIKTLRNMVMRSRDGFERKQMNTRYGRTESETETNEKKSGGLRGLFG